MKRVLVTRPEPGASATAARLRELGFEPVVLPLSRTVSLPVPVSLSYCDAVAVTSANAIRHAPEGLIRLLVKKTCFAVGGKTAAAAASAGFADVREGNGGAADLAADIAEAGKEAVVYLAGRVRLPDFEEALRATNLKMETVETYDTERLDLSAGNIEMLRVGRRIDAVLIYSAKAAQAVQDLVKMPVLAETFSQTVHCCLSERIAERLDGMSKEKIRFAGRPDEAAIFALLDG